MVDVVNLPEGIFYNPEFFDFNLGLPLWVWMILILGFLFVCELIVILYVWKVMRPVAGYGKVGDASAAKGSPTQTFSIWKNRSFEIVSLWYYGNIIAYPEPLKQMQMWFHNSEKATGVAAGKPVMITRDGFDGTVDFIAEMAVCEIPAMFNKDWGFELKQRLGPKNEVILDDDGKPVFDMVERKDEQGRPYHLSSFADIRYRMSLLEKLYPDGVPIPIYQPYDLSKIYQYTPQNEDSLKFGSIVVDDAQEMAQEVEKPPKGFLERNALFLTCGLIGIVSMGMCVVAFPVK